MKPLTRTFAIVATLSVTACAAPVTTFNAIAQDKGMKTRFGKFSVRRDNGCVMAYMKARF